MDSPGGGADIHPTTHAGADGSVLKESVACRETTLMRVPSRIKRKKKCWILFCIITTTEWLGGGDFLQVWYNLNMYICLLATEKIRILFFYVAYSIDLPWAISFDWCEFWSPENILLSIPATTEDVLQPGVSLNLNIHKWVRVSWVQGPSHMVLQPVIRNIVDGIYFLR